MKGIYLSPEGHKELQERIYRLKNGITNQSLSDQFITNRVINYLESILDDATILNAYRSLGHAAQSKGLSNPNGLIIDPAIK